MNGVFHSRTLPASDWSSDAPGVGQTGRSGRPLASAYFFAKCRQFENVARTFRARGS